MTTHSETITNVGIVMKSLLMILTLLAASTVVAGPSALPEYVQSFLNAEDLDYELPRGQFEPYLQSYLDERREAELWSIVGDFNGDNVVDWAGLLRNDRGRLELVVIYSDCDELSYQVLASVGADDDRIVFGVELKTPGEVVGFPTDDNPDLVVSLISPGIHLYYYEKSSVLYYWDCGQFSEMWTSD